MKRVIAVFRLVRLPNTFTAWADICLGFFAVLGAVTLNPTIFYPLIISTLIYWAGFVMNDVFDLAEDRRESPSRPLPAGDISRRAAIIIMTVLLVAALAVAAVRLPMLAVAAVLIGAILLYNGVLKNTPAGPASMGICRLLNVVLGASILIPAAGGELFSAIAPALGVALAAMFFIAGLTFWSRSERGRAKRSDGIAALVCLNISFAAAWFVGFKADWRREEIVVALGAAFTVAFEYLAIRALIANRCEAYNRALRLGLSAIIIYDGLLIAAIVGPAGLLLWVLILPNLILRRFFRTT